MYHTWMRFFTPSPLHHRLGLVCLGVGLQHGTLPTVGPRTLDHHVAVVINAGSGWFAGPDGRRVPVTAPSLIWLTPGTPHHYGADPVTGWDESFVDFTGPPPPRTPNSATSNPNARSSRSPTPRHHGPRSAGWYGRPGGATPCWRWRRGRPSMNSSSRSAGRAPMSAPTATRCCRPWPAMPSSRCPSPSTPPGTA